MLREADLRGISTSDLIRFAVGLLIDGKRTWTAPAERQEEDR